MVNLTGKSTYITFIDSDDFIHPQYIERLHNLAKEYDSELVQCGFEIGENDYFTREIKKTNICKYDNQSIFHSHRLKIPLWGKLYKTSLWHKIRMPVGKTYEDDFTTWKLAWKANAIVITDETLYYYYMKPQSVMRNTSNYINLDFTEAYMERMEFFREIDKANLFELSAELFCVSLMLTYIKCKKNPNNLNNRQEIYRLYLENLQHIIHSESISRKRKIMFRLFEHYPNSISRIVNCLHLR